MHALLLAFVITKQAPPQPPAKNPHPPVTAAENESVAFAERVLQTLTEEGTNEGAIRGEFGLLAERRHTHVVPSSTPRTGASEMAPLQPDEHAVHTYARFTSSARWCDVSVILHRDAQGKLTLRRVLVVPMKSAHKLPPGAKC